MSPFETVAVLEREFASKGALKLVETHSTKVQRLNRNGVNTSIACLSLSGHSCGSLQKHPRAGPRFGVARGSGRVRHAVAKCYLASDGLHRPRPAPHQD